MIPDHAATTSSNVLCVASVRLVENWGVSRARHYRPSSVASTRYVTAPFPVGSSCLQSGSIHSSFPQDRLNPLTLGRAFPNHDLEFSSMTWRISSIDPHNHLLYALHLYPFSQQAKLCSYFRDPSATPRAQDPGYRDQESPVLGMSMILVFTSDNAFHVNCYVV